MDFIVEDGTGLENALSLVSVEFADNYFTQRGNQTWLALNLEQKQVNLVKATDYINIRLNYKNKVINKIGIKNFFLFHINKIKTKIKTIVAAIFLYLSKVESFGFKSV